MLICAVSWTIAQNDKAQTKDITISSKAFDKERKITVYTPEYYNSSSDQKYQVVYVFDAQWDVIFNLVSAINSHLSGTGNSQDFIMVGIHTEGRAREFTPTPVDKRTQENWGKNNPVGESALLDQHLLEEVIPYIEKNYRVLPYRIGIGHSLGATYVLNAMTETPELFNSYIAISPNLVYDYGSILDRMKKKLPTIKALNSFMYVSVGNQGNMENRFGGGIKVLDSLLQTTSIEGFYYKFDYLDDTNHSTSFTKGIPNGLIEYNKLFGSPSEELIESLLKTDDFFAGLKAYYKKRSDWLGYDFIAHEDELNGIAYNCLSHKKPEKGVEVLNWAIEHYPKGINLYDSRAEMYFEMGQKEKSISHYKMGLQKLEEIKAEIDSEDYDYFLGMLKGNLTKVEKAE